MFEQLCDNLNFLMGECKVNASELARHTGLPASSIKKIRCKNSPNPTLTTLIPIAKYFSLTISQLIGEEALPKHDHAKKTPIPLLTLTDCVSWPDITNKRHFSPFAPSVTQAHLFAVTVNEKNWGNFPENSVLIIDAARKASHHDYVLIKNKKINSVSVRQVLIDETKRYFKSLIAGVDAIPDAPDYQIMGVVVANQKTF